MTTTQAPHTHSILTHVKSVLTNLNDHGACSNLRAHPGPNTMPLSTESLWRLEQDFEALNQRIARLASHLGYALTDGHSVEDALHAVSQHIRAEQAPAHEVHLWHEFRGLLVLRYELETRSVQALGAPQLQAVLQTAEDHLARHGIAPDQDGLHLQELFGADEAPDAQPSPDQLPPH